MAISCHLDDIRVSHLYKSQTTPTPLRNKECYLPSYDMLDFCGEVGKLGGGRGCEVPTNLHCAYYSMMKTQSNDISYYPRPL